MLESVKNNNKLLPEQVSEQIANLITDRALHAGDKLPNEFEMAEQLGGKRHYPGSGKNSGIQKCSRDKKRKRYFRVPSSGCGR